MIGQHEDPGLQAAISKELTESRHELLLQFADTRRYYTNSPSSSQNVVDTSHPLC